MQMETKPDTSNLRYCEGHVITVDWQELYGEDCDGFTHAEPLDRDTLAEYMEDEITDEVLAKAGVPETVVAINGIVVMDDYEDAIHDVVDLFIETYVQLDCCEGPMMNYVYPLESIDTLGLESAANLPGSICLVQFSDGNQDRGLPEFGLALTGGGMDLSWCIAGAYVALGFRPPSGVVSNLPRFAGERMTPIKALILQTMREEQEGVIRRAQSAIKLLGEVAEWLEKGGD